jgi:hypothetical protein
VELVRKKHGEWNAGNKITTLPVATQIKIRLLYTFQKKFSPLLLFKADVDVMQICL